MAGGGTRAARGGAPGSGEPLAQVGGGSGRAAAGGSEAGTPARAEGALGASRPSCAPGHLVGHRVPLATAPLERTRAAASLHGPAVGALTTLRRPWVDPAPGPKGLSRGCRSTPRAPSPQTRARPLVLPLALSRTRQSPRPQHSQETQISSWEGGVLCAVPTSDRPAPSPHTDPGRQSLKCGGLKVGTLLGSRGLCPPRDSRGVARGAREWALVIRSFIQPDVHSPTSALFLALSWALGIRTWSSPCLRLHALGLMVPWKARVQESPQGWPCGEDSSPVSAGLACETGVCKSAVNSHPACDAGRCCAIPWD